MATIFLKETILAREKFGLSVDWAVYAVNKMPNGYCGDEDIDDFTFTDQDMERLKLPQYILFVSLENGDSGEIKHGFIDVRKKDNWVRVSPSSMPASGRRVLLRYKNDYGMRRTVIGEWIGEGTEEAYDIEPGDEDYLIYDEEADVYYAKEGFYEICDENGESYFISHDVTEWHPLP